MQALWEALLQRQEEVLRSLRIRQEQEDAEVLLAEQDPLPQDPSRVSSGYRGLGNEALNSAKEVGIPAPALRYISSLRRV